MERPENFLKKYILTYYTDKLIYIKNKFLLIIIKNNIFFKK